MNKNISDIWGISSFRQRTESQIRGVNAESTDRQAFVIFDSMLLKYRATVFSRFQTRPDYGTEEFLINFAGLTD